MRRTARRQRGTAMVELAIVLPVLVVLLFGLAEFGMAFQRWQVLSNAAREGARTAAVQVACDSAEVDRVIQRYVAAAGLEAGDVRVEGHACVASGALVSITVRHDYVFPVLSGLVPGLEDGIPLVGRSVMRKE